MNPRNKKRRMIFNEDSRVKIPSILHLIQLGYQYISLNSRTIHFGNCDYLSLLKKRN